MQRRAFVGGVEGGAPGAGFGVDRAAWVDEGADVGDGVEDPETLASPLGVEGLVEVGGPGWVDRHERNVAGIDAGDVGRSGVLGGFENLGGKTGRDVEFDADGFEAGLELRRCSDSHLRHEP